MGLRDGAYSWQSEIESYVHLSYHQITKLLQLLQLFVHEELPQGQIGLLQLLHVHVRVHMLTPMCVHARTSNIVRRWSRTVAIAGT